MSISQDQEPVPLQVEQYLLLDRPHPRGLPLQLIIATQELRDPVLLITPGHRPIVIVEDLTQILHQQVPDLHPALPEGTTVLHMTRDLLLHQVEDHILRTIAIAGHHLVVAAIEVQGHPAEAAEAVTLPVLLQGPQALAILHQDQAVAAVVEEVAVLHLLEEAVANKKALKGQLMDMVSV